MNEKIIVEHREIGKLFIQTSLESLIKIKRNKIGGLQCHTI